MARSDVIVIINEAHLSYARKDQSMWIECIKNQAHIKAGPRFALFSSFGSATNTVLWIPGSSPVTSERRQRVSLIQQPNWPHQVSLFFNAGEVIDLSKRIIGNRKFSLDSDSLEHLFIQAEGHPGLTHALIRNLFGRPVSSNPSQPVNYLHVN
jgi:hypothetical protein